MTPVTEAELVEKAVAPRVTAEGLEASIKHTYFINVYDAVASAGDHPVDALKILTICVLVLNNGFTITGQSACANPENYNKDIGERLALDDAKKKIWAFLGFVLKEDIHRTGSDTFAGRMVKELAELQGRVERLSAFTTTDAFIALSVESQNDLFSQLVAMRQYEKVLARRVQNIN